MSRAGALAWTTAFAVGLVLGCAERQLGADESEEVAMPACVTVHGRGYWNDGSQHPIVNEDDVTPTVCVCMTWDELTERSLAPPEDFIQDEINDLALAECKRVSAPFGFDWDECQMNYEMGAWQPGFTFAINDYEHRNQQGLICDGSGDDAALTCGLGERGPAGPALLVLAALLGLRRRDGHPRMLR